MPWCAKIGSNIIYGKVNCPIISPAKTGTFTFQNTCHLIAPGTDHNGFPNRIFILVEKFIGHFFANMERWNEVPPHLQELMRVCFEQSHYYRQHWYWAGEARLRVEGADTKLTSISDEEWKTVEEAAQKFWDEIAAESETKAKVVAIFRQYNETMVKAGRPYRNA